MLRSHRHREGASEEFGGRVPAQALHARAHVRHAPFRVRRPDHVARVVGEKAVTLFALPDDFGGGLLGRDVLDHADGATHFAIRPDLDGPRDMADPDLPMAWLQVPVLHLETLGRARPDRARLRDNPERVLGMHVRDPVIPQLRGRRRLEAQHLDGARVAQHPSLLLPRLVAAEVGHVDGLGQFRLAVAQGALSMLEVRGDVLLDRNEARNDAPLIPDGGKSRLFPERLAVLSSISETPSTLCPPRSKLRRHRGVPGGCGRRGVRAAFVRSPPPRCSP